MSRSRTRRASARALSEVDERSGLVTDARWLLFRNVPRSSSWMHVFGSGLLVLLVVQVLTGMALALWYQPGGDTSWESIRFITNDLTLGWLLRGMHHWGASAIVIVMLLHVSRTFLTGAYRYPREMTWMVGSVLFFLVMGMAFTGYLLIWDQRAFWGTVIGVDIGGMTPLLGPFVGNVMRGGGHIGDAILTRFYAVHMLWLPALIVPLVALHLRLVVRLGITPPAWRDDDPAARSDTWS